MFSSILKELPKNLVDLDYSFENKIGDEILC